MSIFGPAAVAAFHRAAARARLILRPGDRVTLGSSCGGGRQTVTFAHCRGRTVFPIRTAAVSHLGHSTIYLRGISRGSTAELSIFETMKALLRSKPIVHPSIGNGATEMLRKSSTAGDHCS